VSIAVNGLTDHIDQLNKELQQTKTQLESIQQMVDVDPVSVIPNRHALVKRLSWSIAMNKRYNGPSSIIVFSITDFESISRTYGYQAGSRVGNYVAEFITNNIRDTDYLARINENQYGAIMYFADLADVQAKAERMCAQIRQAPFRWNNSLVNILLAYGVHAITPADDPESAILNASNAMHVNNSKLKFEQINFKA